MEEKRSYQGYHLNEAEMSWQRGRGEGNPNGVFGFLPEWSPDEHHTLFEPLIVSLVHRL